VSVALRPYRGSLVIISLLVKANAGVNSTNRFGLLGELLLAKDGLGKSKPQSSFAVRRLLPRVHLCHCNPLRRARPLREQTPFERSRKACRSTSAHCSAVVSN
jgi:hypothetical protein